jgi:hypothetical protein
MIPAQLTLIDQYGPVRTVTGPMRSAIKIQVPGCGVTHTPESPEKRGRFKM